MLGPGCDCCPFQRERFICHQFFVFVVILSVCFCRVQVASVAHSNLGGYCITNSFLLSA